MLRLLRIGHISFYLVSLLIINQVLTGCAFNQNQSPSELVLYNWEGDIPQAVLDKFTAEYGIQVRYEVYESQEEAIENIRAGQVYDVVIFESRFIPLLANEGLLAEINYQNVLNFKHISPNFRDLAYDPENRYSIPYSWGVTGLLVRTDMTQGEVTRWSDLWDKQYENKIAIWEGQPREVLALTLKSLGYSANSEDPAELEAALEKLITLKPHLQFLDDFDLETAAPAFASNKIVIAMGYAGDYSASLELGQPIEFIMPEEGALLWGDTFVIPANSPNKETAEMFINFLLLPEISAQIVNEKHYASANQSASAFIEPDVLNDPSIYPKEALLKDAEIILPLSAASQELYDKIWQQFLNAETK